MTHVFNKRKVGGTVMAIVASMMLLFSYIPPALSQATGTPFGGPITFTYFCGCTANFLITIGPPTPGTLIYQPGISLLFPNGQILGVGRFILGSAVPFGVCIPLESICLAPIPATLGTISMVGTN